MNKPRICGVITDSEIAAIEAAAEYVDMYELRIDMVGSGWHEIASFLKKPWIACCRSSSEGGRWNGDEETRLEILLDASEKGASIIDMELDTDNIREKAALFKKRSRCLISFHDFNGTPATADLENIVKKQLEAGADICKVVTTAGKIEDNYTVLELIGKFPGNEIVAFTMGDRGYLSRVLCPLSGGSFTYASLSSGRESAPGQLKASGLRRIYGTVQTG